MAKKTKVVKSEKELAEENMAFSLKELRMRFYSDPPPNVKFSIGERVQRGNIDKSIITDILDGGRIYLLHENHLENHYGTKVPMERNSYVSWVEIHPWRSLYEDQKIERFSEEDTISLSYSQMDLSSILSKLYHFGIDMNPDYQRGNVWDLKDKVRLIASIFMNVDIGKFVFIELPYKDNSPSYEILDGKQRVIAISEFYEGRYKFNGYYFNDLCQRDRNTFRHHSVSVATVRNESIKLSDKYRYFLRLNVGGKPQDPEHIKKVETLYKQAIAEGK